MLILIRRNRDLHPLAIPNGEKAKYSPKEKSTLIPTPIPTPITTTTETEITTETITIETTEIITGVTTTTTTTNKKRTIGAEAKNSPRMKPAGNVENSFLSICLFPRKWQMIPTRVSRGLMFRNSWH